MSLKNKIIMICGPARCGKDTLFPILKNQMENKYGGKWLKYAFADTLRKDMADEIWNKYGVSVWDDSEKHIFRGDLINYGKQRRDETNGLYLITNFINKAKKDYNNYIITDHRFINEYENIKSRLSLMYDIYPIYIERFVKISDKKFVLIPEIDQEIENYPEIKKVSTVNEIEWMLGVDWYEELESSTYFKIE